MTRSEAVTRAARLQRETGERHVAVHAERNEFQYEWRAVPEWRADEWDAQGYVREYFDPDSSGVQA